MCARGELTFHHSSGLPDLCMLELSTASHYQWHMSLGKQVADGALVSTSQTVHWIMTVAHTAH
jgi:hypothetical protein